MKRLAVLSALALCLAVILPPASAQSNDRNHGDFGVYFDYTRLQAASLNMFGVGARLGINVHPAVALEGEVAYDFERSTTNSTFNGVTGTTPVRSNLRLIHGLFGPKIQSTKGPVRVFLVLKGGILNFGVAGPATAGSFANQFGTLRDGDTNGVFYPGGGIEFNAGPIGLRLEAGDEMYWDNGVNHNFKFMGGPQIRF